MNVRVFVLGLLVLGGVGAAGCDGLRKNGGKPTDGGATGGRGSGGLGAGGSGGGGVGTGGSGAGVTGGGGVTNIGLPGCTAGTACIPANPCHEGESACSAAGVMSCTDTMRNKSNGSVCDDGSVCRDGACVACAAGTACDVAGKPCRTGMIACTTGAPVCTEADNQLDGTSCGTAMVCQAGTCTACVAGQACTPTSVCHKGSLVCTAGTSQCTDTTMNLVAGTTCGKDMVCGPTGACVACIAGASCVVPGNPCRTGMTVCNTGAPVCLESGNAANGTSCGTANVCSGGACVACTEGLTCVPTNPCHGGKTVCAPAISCVDSATMIANGTSCGTDKVCSNGTCAACAAGKACQPTNPCKTGTTSCATGVSTCVESGNTANGASCGTNMVCASGSCVACMAGASCPPANPCHRGTLACDTGAAVCTDTAMSLTDGTTCGSNQVCRAGMCVACTAGGACQPANPCKAGTFSCATGSQVCMESGNKPTGMSCATGTTGMVCNAGTCVACNTGGTCTPANACHNGTLSCATGSAMCTDSGTMLADGAPCGMANLYCRAGVCTPCTPNLPCLTNPNQCRNGITSCATGVSACIDGTNKNAGSPCGSNMVCNSANACIACTAGMSCPPPGNRCHNGSFTCGTGAPVCTDLGTSVLDGTNCGTSLFCRTGMCLPCTEGATCTPTNPCKNQGTTSCATGSSACIDGGNKTNGTACPPAQSCTGGVKTLASTCTGGVCSAPATMTCATGVCSGTDCLVCGGGQVLCGGTCCAAGMDCCNGVCASLNTNSNCGRCGMICPPTANGSPICNGAAGCNVTCLAGHLQCGTTTCCNTPPTGAVAVCPSCAFQCNPGFHSCTGVTPFACFDNASVDKCGPGCIPCTEPNANPVCNGTQCANTCVNPAALRLGCSGGTGQAFCGAWDFETVGSTEGWTLTPNAASAASNLVSSTAHPRTLSRSLAVTFTHSASPLRDSIFLNIKLCPSNQALSLAGRTFSSWVFLAPSPANVNTAFFNGFWAIVAAAGVSGGDFSLAEENTWIQIPTVTLVDGVQQMELRMSAAVPWSGTLYFDSIVIQ